MPILKILNDEYCYLLRITIGEKCTFRLSPRPPLILIFKAICREVLYYSSIRSTHVIFSTDPLRCRHCISDVNSGKRKKITRTPGVRAMVYWYQSFTMSLRSRRTCFQKSFQDVFVEKKIPIYRLSAR